MKTFSIYYVDFCLFQGKPSALFDVANADWAPSLNLGKSVQTFIKNSRAKKGKNDKRNKILPPEKSSQEDYEKKMAAISVPGVACQTEITCEGFRRLEDMYKKVLEENIALRKEIETFRSLARGHNEHDEALMNSDYEGKLSHSKYCTCKVLSQHIIREMSKVI